MHLFAAVQFLVAFSHLRFERFPVAALSAVEGRRMAYGNLTCPQNCTCSYQHAAQQQLDILAPKQVVDCDHVTLDNIKELFAVMPDRVTSFTLRRAGLTNLADMCCMEDLETLDASYNRISDVIVYLEFEKLTFLNLQSNALRILRKDEFISFPNVKILNVDSNEVEIIDQDAFRLTNLKELYLSQNKIVHINERIFRYASSLELLNLNGNRLTSVHAKNFYYSRNIKNLDLSNNHITRVDDNGFDELLRLDELNLAYNNLSSPPIVALQKLTALRSLTLDGNPFFVFENSTFFRMASLETLRLDQCKELAMILENAFHDLPNLRRLSVCSCRRLQYVSPEAFGRNVGSLKELYLTNNALITLPATVFRETLQKIDFSGKQLNCECARASISRLSKDVRSKLAIENKDTHCVSNDYRVQTLFQNENTVTTSQCKPMIIPNTNDTINCHIGVRLSLYCAIIEDYQDSSTSRPRWTLPDGRILTSGQRFGRFAVDKEKLSLDFVLQNDSGRYMCSYDSASSIRYIDLETDNISSIIYAVDVSAYYVTWSWSTAPFVPAQNGKREAANIPRASPPGECRLLFRSSKDKEYLRVDLPITWERYTVNRLQPETNYTFCLVYYKSEVALYTYCTNVVTEKAFLHFGVSLNYSLISLLAISISLVCALCIARCVHKRLHVWQEEKYRGRMQESMSAQGFLSSFESLSNIGNSSVAAVTYENHGAQDRSSRYEEEETALSESTDITTVPVGSRKTPSSSANSSRATSVVVVETHAVA